MIVFTPWRLVGADGSIASRIGDARWRFEKIFDYANEAEEVGHREGAERFPQLLTRLGSIGAAYNLNRALGEED